jgi:class 3 adenylate cyclase
MTSVAPTDRGAAVAGPAVSAETRLARLLQRLLDAAATSLAAGDLEPARSTAEEVRAVDPDNRRAAEILHAVSARQLGPSGERALMTLLFSDLVGSTMLSEQVELEQLRDLFAFYRAAARDAVHRYGGSLMHYSGDGILAGFGYPEAHEDDARRAVLAGLDLATAMRDARADLDRRFGVTPRSGSGSTPVAWWSPTSAATTPSPLGTRSSAWCPTSLPGSSRTPSRAGS